MADQPEIRGKQKAVAGRDAFIAGRDLIVHVAAVGTGSPGVPGLLPRDVPAFTGREGELARLTGLAGGGRVVVTAISGTAGVGKTALAVHAAHQLADEFPDGHLYADLRGYTEGQDPAQPGEVLEAFLRSLRVPPDEVPSRIEEQSGLLRQLLASRRVLMVLDNARTEAQVRPLLPGTGGSLVLVTSRSMLPGLEVDERISLDVLPDDEAAAMLTELIGEGRAAAEPEAVTEVAGLCGRLPLALRIAGQLLAAHPAWPVERLTRMLVGEQDRLVRLGAGNLQVRSAFEVSYRQLAQEDARLFRLLGLHPGPGFDAAAAAALAETEDEAVERALDRLAEVHLVTEEAVGLFGMHDLLRLFARSTCRETDNAADRDAAETRLIRHYANVAELLDSLVDPRLRPAAEQNAEQAGEPLPSIRQALTMFQAERPNLLAALGLAAQRGWDERVRQLSESMMDSLTVLHYLDDMRTVMEAALAAARHAGDILTESRTLTNLGEAYRHLQRFEEAITCYQESLTILRETGDRYGEGVTLNNLGLAYGESRRFEKAIACYQESLALLRETGYRIDEGRTLNNLGLAYGELRRFEEAITCYHQSLTIYRETSDRHGEGQTLANLGEIYRHLRRFEEAIACYRQSLTILRETGDRHGEGRTLSYFGNAYDQMGQPDRAATCWREAAAAIHDAGDHQTAELLEQQAANAPSRRRWRRRANRSSKI